MWAWAYWHPFMFFFLAMFGMYMVISKGTELLLEIIKLSRWR